MIAKIRILNRPLLKAKFFVRLTSFSYIYYSCNFILYIHNIFRYGEKQRRADSQELSGIQLLSATAYQLKKPYQQLLIPITIWIGMEQAFIGADFTQVFFIYIY